MAYTTIKKPTDYFDTKLYTGTGSNITVSDIPFNPDFVWFKKRDGASASELYDQIRGTTKYLISNSTDAEDTNVNGLTAFGTGGWTIGGNGLAHSGTMVAWNWKANGAGSTNTDGNNPNTVTVSANTTAGFSIIKYQGTDTGGQTIGHGLGVKPKLFICKNISEADNWMVWIDTTGNGTADKRVILNSTASDYGNYMPTFGTSTITLPSTSDNSWNGNGDNIIGYAFAEKKGYSKFGSYTGNGNNDGTFVYTGFKPAWILIKQTSGTNLQSWWMIDAKRDPYNVCDENLRANTNSAASESYDMLDIVSNGFKTRWSDTAINGDGVTYVYIAFAAEPLVGDNPATAR